MNSEKQPPKRPPGRPATENLGRFYLSTGLLSHPKALRLRRELILEERDIFLLVARLFEFVATFAGSSGHIPRSDYGALAAFCFWDGDPFLLVSAFRRAGFIDNEGDVHGWLEFQPDALKRASRRKKSTDIQEVNTSTEAAETAPGIMADKIEHNSNGGKTGPEEVLESLTTQNQTQTQALVFSEQQASGAFLEQSLLSEREYISKSITKSSRARAREDQKPKTELGAKVSALIDELAKRAQNSGPKLGPLAHLAELVFSWCEIQNPSPGQLSRLRLAVAQIGQEGVERLVRDFQERDYNPTNRLAALCGAARAEADNETKTKPAGIRPAAPQDAPNNPEEGK